MSCSPQWRSTSKRIQRVKTQILVSRFKAFNCVTATLLNGLFQKIKTCIRIVPGMFCT